MTGAVLAILAFLLAAASMAGWMRGLQNVTLRGRRGLFVASFSAAFALAVAAFIQGPGLFGALAAGVTVIGSGIFLGLTALGSQEAREPAVSVGGPVVDFTAPLDDDTLFDSTTLRGKPFLLKFFRGHW